MTSVHLRRRLWSFRGRRWSSFWRHRPRYAADRLAALAQYSGNALVAVGYDCIPVVSADLVPAAESERFPRYLSALKFARRIAGISTSAAVEFGGFASALPAQGLTPPIVFECRLPTESMPKAGA